MRNEKGWRRTKRTGKTALTALLLAAALSACGAQTGQTADSGDLEQYRTEYIGDNTKVIGIASRQSYPKGYAYDHIAMQTETEPYALTVYLQVEAQADDVGELDENAALTYSLIGNLGDLYYVNAADETALASYQETPAEKKK